MIKVLHISTECYPAAKAGGMGDVVGALPAYLPEHDVTADVVVPYYKTSWIVSHTWTTLHTLSLELGEAQYIVYIKRLKEGTLPFALYAVDIPDLFYRSSIYLDKNGEGYHDEIERYIAFQRCVLDWLLIDNNYDILHCHDHMTGLIPFFLKHSERYVPLKKLSTVFTIHNGQYRGVMDWKWRKILPEYNESVSGLMDWDGSINGLATAVKCCDVFTTVSPTYMNELIEHSDTLTPLMKSESDKAVGIINGIDNAAWDPKTDSRLHYTIKKSVRYFKSKNKKDLAEKYDFSSKSILIGFIGRFAHQKGADLLVSAYRTYLENSADIHFFILGSGDKQLEKEVIALQEEYPDQVTSVIAYDESLAHKIYAASDFLIMPSRFEPCGLNQMYAMRYGAIPIVRHTGGLKDTVPDIGDDGYGISFLQATTSDILYSLGRAKELYDQKTNLNSLREKIMSLDFSWGHSAKLYSKLYHKILKL